MILHLVSGRQAVRAYDVPFHAVFVIVELNSVTDIRVDFFAHSQIENIVKCRETRDRITRLAASRAACNKYRFGHSFFPFTE